MYQLDFNFNERVDGKALSIHTKELFTEKKGYGFIDHDHIQGKTNSETALYAGGWNMRSLAKISWKNSYAITDYGVESNRERYPVIFKVLVPKEGTYRIHIKIDGGDAGVKNMMIFTNRRNLVQRDINIPAHESFERTFIVSVCPYIPAMTSIPSEERAIYVSVVGNPGRISELSIEKADSPVIYIAGDSTLTDQSAMFPYYPADTCGGWAQMLLQYCEQAAICNQAHSGLTTNCFRDDGHWEIVKRRIHPGDIFMLQFGHNDQKRRNLAAFGGYIQNIRWYVLAIRNLGATPVIISPISRIPIVDNEAYCSLLTDHAIACKNVAEELNVPFIDLHQKTFDFFCGLGEKAHHYFCGNDSTHTNDFGAMRIAEFAYEEIKKQAIFSLRDTHIVTDTITEWNSLEEDVVCPVEPVGERGLYNIELPYVDIAGIPQYDSLNDAMRKGLLDPCVMHLHPFEAMPRGQFLFVYIKALRMSGKRPYLGYYCDIGRFEWDAAFVQAALDENLIDLDTTLDFRFRPDDALIGGELLEFLIRGLKPTVKARNLTMKECEEEANKLGLIFDGYIQTKPVKRADCYSMLAKMMDLMDSSTKEMPDDIEIHPVG